LNPPIGGTAPAVMPDPADVLHLRRVTDLKYPTAPLEPRPEQAPAPVRRVLLPTCLLLTRLPVKYTPSGRCSFSHKRLLPGFFHAYTKPPTGQRPRHGRPRL